MSDRILTFQYAKDNFDAIKKQTIPTSNECMTKLDVDTYLNADMSVLSSYTDNRLIPRIKVSSSQPACYDFNDEVVDMAVQPDGKIIVVGRFTQYKGQTAIRIARINTDTTLDTTFNIGSGFALTTANYSLSLNVVKLQSDGKILVGGCFSHFNSVEKYSLVRLNSDGSLDTSFNTNVFYGSDTGGTYATICNDIMIFNNNIYVGGYLLNNDYTKPLAKLSMSGTNDSSFAPVLKNPNYGTVARVYSIDNDGTNIYVSGSTLKNKNIVKVSQSGVIDTGFIITDNILNDESVVKVKIQPSYGLLYAVSFSNTSLRRCLLNGTFDTTFTNPNINSVTNIKIDNSNNIYVTSYMDTDTSLVHKLQPNGAIDSSFIGQTSDNYYIYTYGSTIEIGYSGNSILIGGSFTRMSVYNVGNFVRVKQDGSYDLPCIPCTLPNPVTISASGIQNGISVSWSFASQDIIHIYLNGVYHSSYVPNINNIVTNTTITGLPANTTYTVSATRNNGCGESVMSNIVSVTTQSAVTYTSYGYYKSDPCSEDYEIFLGSDSIYYAYITGTYTPISSISTYWFQFDYENPPFYMYSRYDSSLNFMGDSSSSCPP